MRLIISLLFALVFSSAAHAKSPYRGWDYLAARLERDGFSETYLRSVFGNPRMPEHEDIGFAVAPKEHEQMYSNFTTAKKLDRAMRCMEKTPTAFKKAEQLFGVPRTIIAAILLIETQCGDYTGKEMILNRLARLASLNEPENVRRNYARLREADPAVSFDGLEKRAAYLDRVFYPEVIALLRLCRREHIDVFSIRGSSAGAFGLGQFLPSTFLRYAADGNKDGKIDLMNPEDAVWSIAHYLSAEGWDSKRPLASNREVLWKYNHSDPYIDAVMKVSILLDKRLKGAAGTARK